MYSLGSVKSEASFSSFHGSLPMAHRGFIALNLFISLHLYLLDSSCRCKLINVK